YHSTAATYPAEAHAVPSPDGRRVVFASDWADHALIDGVPTPGARSYVIDAREGGNLAAPGPVASGELRLDPPRPNPGPGPLRVRFLIPQHRPVALELFDVSGRRLRVVDAGALGVGEHDVELDPDDRLAAGVYFVTLTDGRQHRGVRAVVLR